MASQEQDELEARTHVSDTLCLDSKVESCAAPEANGAVVEASSPELSDEQVREAAWHAACFPPGCAASGAASTGLLSSPGSTEPAGVPAAAQKLVARLVCEEHCNVFFTGNAGTGASCAPQRHNICFFIELCLMWL